MNIKITDNNQSGYTIVELIVTLIVAAILIGTLSVITNNNAFMTQRGRNMTSSNSFAENKVEELRSKGFLAVGNGTTDITADMPSDLANPRSANIQVSDASAGLKLITVTINYSEQGRNQTQIYKTYMGELGVGQY